MQRKPDAAREEFNVNFAKWVPRWITEQRHKARELAINRELREIEATPTVSLLEEVALIEQEIKRQIDLAEDHAIAARVGGNIYGKLLEVWRANGITHRGVPVRSMVLDLAWREEQTAGLNFCATRALMKAACEQQRRRIKNGEVPSTAIPPEVKVERLAALTAERDAIRADLHDEQFHPWWRKDGGYDLLNTHVEQYVGSQIKCDFPIKPENMIETHMAYGDLTSKHDQRAAAATITDPERLAAWDLLREYLAEQEAAAK